MSLTVGATPIPVGGRISYDVHVLLARFRVCCRFL